MEQNKKYSPNIQYLKYSVPASYAYEGLKEQVQEAKDEKAEKFKIRLNEFQNVYTLTEAKKLLQKNMPVVLERTTFYIGKSKCVIINTDKQLRIMYDSPEEFISYDFV